LPHLFTVNNKLALENCAEILRVLRAVNAALKA
jgi:hypothetical protein